MGKKRTKDEDGLFDSATEGEDSGAGTASSQEDDPTAVALHEATQTRYLNYALSVITSRALPDVRDGVKPVQRRILYTMWRQGVKPDAKYRKCAAVVGDVMGAYHPHGDMAIYDALVRMAQPFSLRYPLIDGSGNFGSLDGDAAAAMRYTECRLAPIAAEMLIELDQQTVPFRPNYDGTKQEPVVLPARIPNLLINGTTGIAVGMATNIPPHNLREVCTALLKLLENPEMQTNALCRYIKGPDFPTGAQILNTSDELKQIYRDGQGAVRVRGEWELGEQKRSSKFVYITSIPYMVNKAQLVERIADVVVSRKLPLLLDVKDLSTDDIRVQLEIKKDADEQKVMAYLFKNTPLQSNFNVNLTCLIPTENPEVGRPERCDLREMLLYFLQFRLEVVTNRLEHELGQLERRIHILEGFETVFDALDEILKIIRASEGKADSAKKIMAKYPLDADQTDAILELKLYRLARLEILVIREELEEKQARAEEIRELLADTEATGRWSIVRAEIEEIRDTYGKTPQSKRRTIIAEPVDEPEFSAEDFIIAEDAVVIVTKDGWVKRQREIKDLSTQRLREGDEVLTAQPGSTKEAIVFFTNFGAAYTMRIADIPSTTGYGEPIQRFFKFADGEKIIAAFSLDPRLVGDINRADPDSDQVPPAHGLTATSDGYALRFDLSKFAENSTKSGRKYAKPAKGAHVVGVQIITREHMVMAASQSARAIVCKSEDINFLASPGKGVMLMKLGKGDVLLGFKATTAKHDPLELTTTRGGSQTITLAKYPATGRGGKGREVIKRGSLTGIVHPAPTAPAPLNGGTK